MKKKNRISKKEKTPLFSYDELKEMIDGMVKNKSPFTDRRALKVIRANGKQEIHVLLSDRSITNGKVWVADLEEDDEVIYLA